jgi:hypothetical protein
LNADPRDDDKETVISIPLLQSTAVDSNSAFDSKLGAPVLNEVEEAEEEDDDVINTPKSHANSQMVNRVQSRLSKNKTPWGYGNPEHKEKREHFRSPSP